MLHRLSSIPALTSGAPAPRFIQVKFYWCQYHACRNGFTIGMVPHFSAVFVRPDKEQPSADTPATAAECFRLALFNERRLIYPTAWTWKCMRLLVPTQLSKGTKSSLCPLKASSKHLALASNYFGSRHGKLVLPTTATDDAMVPQSLHARLRPMSIPHRRELLLLRFFVVR